jgi:NAD-dependent SIR2 family protein deacetylase
MLSTWVDKLTSFKGKEGVVMSEEPFLDWRNYPSYEEYVFQMTGKRGSYTCAYCGTPYTYAVILELEGGEHCDKCGAELGHFKWVWEESEEKCLALQ